MNKELAKVIMIATPYATIASLVGLGVLRESLDQKKTIKKLKEELSAERMKSTIAYVRDQYVYDKQFEDIVTKIEN